MTKLTDCCSHCSHNTCRNAKEPPTAASAVNENWVIPITRLSAQSFISTQKYWHFSKSKSGLLQVNYQNVDTGCENDPWKGEAATVSKKLKWRLRSEGQRKKPYQAPYRADGYSAHALTWVGRGSEAPAVKSIRAHSLHLSSPCLCLCMRSDFCECLMRWAQPTWKKWSSVPLPLLMFINCKQSFKSLILTKLHWPHFK